VLRQLLLQVLEAKLQQIEEQNVLMQVVEGHTNCGIVIEGGALQYALNKYLMDDLMALCAACKAVVCCRVTPKQKADVSSPADNCPGSCVHAATGLAGGRGSKE
jgi:magnesium-transporting ATPase (P-type)